MRIYLDQNKWIDLARLDTGHAEGQQFREVGALLEKCVEGGRVILPISGIHLMETAGTGKEQRRMDVAKVMLTRSQGAALRPFMVMFPLELEERLRRYVGLEPISAYDAAVGRGTEDALGGFDSPELRELSEGQRLLFRHVLSTDPEFAIPLMAYSTEAYREFARQVDESGARQIAAVRARARAEGATRDDLLLHNQRSFYRSNYMPSLMTLVKSLGMDHMDMSTWNEPRPGAAEFMMSIPSVDVWMTTTVERDFDWNRDVTGNDIRDQAFLSTAIPHCEVVVTERYWGAAAIRTGLADRHNTKVLRTLHELTPILRDVLAS